MAGVSAESLLRRTGYRLDEVPAAAYRLALRLYLDQEITAQEAVAVLRTFIRANLRLERDPRDWVVVGIDVGSGGLRIVAITADGQIVSVWSKPFPTRPATDLGEILAVLNEGMRSIVKEVSYCGRSVAAIGLATTISDLVFLNSKRQVIHRVIAWPEAVAVEEAAEVAELNGAMGGVIGASGTTVEGLIPRLLREVREHPNLAHDVAHVCELSELIASELTGELCANTAARLRKWGFIDPPSGLLAQLGLAAFASKLELPGRRVGERIGELKLSVAYGWRMPDPAPVVQAGWDTLAAAHALSVQRVGIIALTLGTSWNVAARSPLPRVNAMPSLQPQAVPGVPGWFVWAGFLHAGDLIDSICNEFCQAEIESARRAGVSVYDLLDARTVQSDHRPRVRCIPGGRRWLTDAGELTLAFDLGVGGCLTPRDIYGAVRTGLVQQLALLVKYLRDHVGLPVSVIRAGGHGAESDPLLQWIADATGCDVQRGPEHATALGAAMSAATGIGICDSLAEAALSMARTRQTFLCQSTAGEIPSDLLTMVA